MSSTTLAVAAGCTVGTGLAVLVRELLRPQPSLAEYRPIPRFLIPDPRSRVRSMPEPEATALEVS